MIRRIFHAGLVILAAVPWLIGIVGFGCAYVFVLLADRLWPNAHWGNCWSFAGPRWVKHGGYLLVRWADGVRIPHVVIVHSLPEDGVSLQQFVPIRRRRGWRAFFDSLYFRGKVLGVEKPHPSRWGGL